MLDHESIERNKFFSSIGWILLKILKSAKRKLAQKKRFALQFCYRYYTLPLGKHY